MKKTLFALLLCSLYIHEASAQSFSSQSLSSQSLSTQGSSSSSLESQTDLSPNREQQVEQGEKFRQKELATAQGSSTHPDAPALNRDRPFKKDAAVLDHDKAFKADDPALDKDTLR